MRQKGIFLGAVLVVLQLCSNLAALPRTAQEAEMVVTGWLQDDPQPFEMALGTDVLNVETFADDRKDPVYYIVNLYPAGFVIVSADDQVEPIVGFADKGFYDPSSEKPLGALVTRDMPSRIRAARDTFSLLAVAPDAAPSATQKKWNRLIGLAEAQASGSRLMLATPIRDRDPTTVWIAPLARAEWGQTYAIGRNNRALACYNYYTPPGDPCDPRNYPCGCVATFMAELMHSHKHPVLPVERATFTIEVNGKPQQRTLRGGEGLNGAYNWDDMIRNPDDNATDRQRRAIGALCHDAGVSIGMSYWPGGSGALLDAVAIALVNTFQYGNAIWAENGDVAIGYQDLMVIINSNLDADLPVALAILEDTKARTGHAILCDGYGYQESTPYHHLNMGWYGYANCWYNLPDIEVLYGPTYRTVFECLYNIYKQGKGEIVSGRIMDGYGFPIRGATVSGTKSAAGPSRTDVTNQQGIYGLSALDSNSTYALTVNKAGYDFERAQVNTGTSRSGDPASGNRWGVNFVGRSNEVTITIGTGTLEWGYPLHTNDDDSRTQVIYLAQEIGTAATITSLSLDVVTRPGRDFDKLTIRMKHTAMNEYSTCALDAEGWTVVYQKQNTSVDEGWQKFQFQTPFEYNGTDNLLVDFSHDNSSDSEDGYCRASRPGGSRSVYAGSDSRDGDPLEWPATVPPNMRCTSYVPNVKLTLAMPSRVLPSAVK